MKQSFYDVLNFVEAVAYLASGSNGNRRGAHQREEAEMNALYTDGVGGLGVGTPCRLRQPRESRRTADFLGGDSGGTFIWSFPADSTGGFRRQIPWF